LEENERIRMDRYVTIMEPHEEVPEDTTTDIYLARTPIHKYKTGRITVQPALVESIQKLGVLLTDDEIKRLNVHAFMVFDTESMLLDKPTSDGTFNETDITRQYAVQHAFVSQSNNDNDDITRLRESMIKIQKARHAGAEEHSLTHRSILIAAADNIQQRYDVVNRKTDCVYDVDYIRVTLFTKTKHCASLFMARFVHYLIAKADEYRLARYKYNDVLMERLRYLSYGSRTAGRCILSSQKGVNVAEQALRLIQTHFAHFTILGFNSGR
jgi:hypothetical protein